MNRWLAIGLALIMLVGSFHVLSGQQEIHAAPTRAEFRYFKGNISGLEYDNPDGVPDIYGLNITGTMINGTTFNQEGEIDINLSDNGSFVATVDNEFHDGSAWLFELDDCYGWEEAGEGTVDVPDPTGWGPINPTYTLPNGTLYYRKGHFGNISITMINGTSGEPLEGVGFTFERHHLHSTISSGNLTNGTGEVMFRDLQIGLDETILINQSYLVTVDINKGNFTYNDGNGTNVAKLLLVNGTTTEHELVMDEDPLVAGFSPQKPEHTDIPVDRDQVPNNVFIRFRDDMDKTSVDSDTVYMRKEGGEKVNISYSWPTSDYCKLQPNEDLEYNTTYKVVVTPRVTNQTGYELLWRTFEFNFTTELRPAVLRCHVYINGTVDPAPEGTMIQLGTGLPKELEDGYYEFDNVVPRMGGYTVNVIGPTVGGIQEYLYYGNEVSGIEAQRGEVIDVPDLVVNKRPVKEAIIEVMDQDGEPLGNANVTHQITGESRFTGPDGRVTFQDILIGMNTTFRASKDNYIERPVTVPFGPEDPTVVNVTLFENEFPVTVKARSEFTREIEPGYEIPVDSRIQIEFEDEDGFSLDMDPETMDTDNLKIFDSADDEIQIDIEQKPGDASTWTLEPRDLLYYNAEYTLFISEGVVSDTGINPLWRDYTLDFVTEELDDSIVSGRVTLREKGVEEVLIEVMKGDSVIGTAVTDFNGNYFATVEQDELTMYNITVKADGSEWGLSTEIFGPISLNAGGYRNFTDFRMERRDDWYNVIYPKDEEGRMPIDGKITLRFKNPLDHSDEDSFAENFTLTSPNVPLDINVSGDGKTVILEPTRNLDHDKLYTLSISDFQEGEFHRELMDVNGTPALIRGEKVEIVTEFKPIEAILQAPSTSLIDETPVDIPITVFFTNYSVDRNMVEAAIELREADSGKPVGNISFSWSQNKTLQIMHDDFRGLTEYELLLPAGKYGAGVSEGAKLEEDFVVYFTTEVVRVQAKVDKIWPSPRQGEQMTVTLENPLGIRIWVVILVEEEFGSGDYMVYENLTLEPTETDRQVTLNTEDLDQGEYFALIRVYDPESEILLHEYPININVQSDDDGGDDQILWIFLVVGGIVILIAILSVLLFMQSRKKTIEEELKEEFECPECHHLVSEDDTVCPHCGAEFEEEAYKCPKCGSMLDPEDEECPECGYDFEDQEKMELDDDDDIELGDMELDEEDEDLDEMELDEEEEMEEE